MSYYKITYESNTIEGLKALQGSFLGQSASTADSTNLETPAPPPPQLDQDKADTFSVVMQAPPAPPERDAGLPMRDEVAAPPPPPTGSDSATADSGLRGEVSPPPNNQLLAQEDDGAKPNEGVVPPPKSESKSLKSSKKASK